MWLVVLAAALVLDRHVAQWVRQTHPYPESGPAVWAVKLPGSYPLVLAVAVLVAVFHRQSWRAAFQLILSGPLVGAGYSLLKWTVGRQRPKIAIAPFDFHPFHHGVIGLVHAESGLSFPSGHAAMAFAAATCLAAVLPRWAVAFFAIAGAVAAERVLENAHYLSDVVAGAGVGVLCGLLALYLSNRWTRPKANAIDVSNRLSTPSPGTPGEGRVGAGA